MEEVKPQNHNATSLIAFGVALRACAGAAMGGNAKAGKALAVLIDKLGQNIIDQGHELLRKMADGEVVAGDDYPVMKDDPIEGANLDALLLNTERDPLAGP